MVAKMARKISSKTAGQMITWSHFTFLQRLLEKIKEFSGVKVKTVTEEYKSETS